MKLSIEFSKILREWLGAEVIQQINKLNETEDNLSICHSHDFCDANLAMAEAFEKVHGEKPEINSDKSIEKWNSAWKEAILNKFKTN